MIYLTLFLTFLKIGAFTFGGGYAMIPIIREAVLSNAWLSDGEFINFIAVAESTPGPIAVNMATFIGSSQGGILGAIVATLGVVLPSFIIILLIVAIFKNLLNLLGVKWALSGIKPVVAGLIMATGVTLVLSTLCGIKTVKDGFSFDYKGVIIFAVIIAVATLYNKLLKKKISPILLIILSAILGLILYAL